MQILSAKENTPKLSVVTPSFNQGRFLEECIDSVLSQGYPKLEYLIIDGGSTDNSVEIIKKYDKYLTYWISKKDNGQADAINKGFRKATGVIVSWLNSDDFLLPMALKNIAESYIKNPRAPFHYGNGYRGDINGNKISRYFEKGTVCFNYKAMLLGLNYILQPSAFIRRSSLINICYLNTSLHYGMDSDLWLNLAKTGDPQPIADCLSVSREYGETKTSMGSFARVEELRLIAEKHSDHPLTPGTLLYFLDTLFSFVKDGDSAFPPEFTEDIEEFWRRSSKILLTIGAGEDGIPLKTLKNEADGRILEKLMQNIDGFWSRRG